MISCKKRLTHILNTCYLCCNLQGLCQYTLKVKTGYDPDAGTYSQISVFLNDRNGEAISIPNLEKWGPLRPLHSYFQTGNTDILTGRGPCTRFSICKISLSSDGCGPSPDWLCDEIQVTTNRSGTGVIDTVTFDIDRWVFSEEEAVEMDHCV